jgi:hypothetical protein
MAALLAGQGVSEVARQYRIDPSVVSRIKTQIPTDRLQEVAQKKEIRIDELLLDYLQKNLMALAAQAVVASDEEYLRQQPASELATLHGVMVDKAVRLLEAGQAARTQGPGPEREGDSRAIESGPGTSETGRLEDESSATASAANSTITDAT